MELEDLGLGSRIGTGRGLAGSREREWGHQQDPSMKTSLPISFKTRNFIEEFAEVARMTLSGPFRPSPFPSFLLRSLELTRLIKEKGKYQKAIFALSARIGKMSQIN